MNEQPVHWKKHTEITTINEDACLFYEIFDNFLFIEMKEYHLQRFP